MTNITIPREVGVKALEALEKAHHAMQADMAQEEIEGAITAIKAALEKPAQEPVYLAWFYEEEGWFETTKDHYDITDEEDRWLLYTAPPKPTAQNFCSRCGKRTPDLTTIHTCTPPHGLEMT